MVNPAISAGLLYPSDSLCKVERPFLPNQRHPLLPALSQHLRPPCSSLAKRPCSIFELGNLTRTCCNSAVFRDVTQRLTRKTAAETILNSALFISLISLQVEIFPHSNIRLFEDAVVLIKMEVASSVSLEAAKSSFLSLLSGVDPSEAGEFVDWVLQSCSGIHTNGDIALHITETCPTQKEKKLKKIIKDIKKRVPLNAILMSEKIYSPEGKVREQLKNSQVKSGQGEGVSQTRKPSSCEQVFTKVVLIFKTFCLVNGK